MNFLVMARHPDDQSISQKIAAISPYCGRRRKDNLKRGPSRLRSIRKFVLRLTHRVFSSCLAGLQFYQLLKRPCGLGKVISSRGCHATVVHQFCAIGQFLRYLKR